jgi:hypothetical protein
MQDTVIKAASTIVAIVAIFRLRKRMKAKLAPHAIMLKFFAFKGVILLMFVQNVRQYTEAFFLD